MNEEDALPLLAPDFFRVGEFLIRPTLKAIRPFQGFDAPSSAEKDRRLPDKAIAVLMKLAEKPRRVYSREELLDEVWGQEREAYDRVLDNAISELRRAFGDNARKPRYIETITKQGYRLIAPVEWPPRLEAEPDRPDPAEAPRSQPYRPLGADSGPDGPGDGESFEGKKRRWTSAEDSPPESALPGEIGADAAESSEATRPVSARGLAPRSDTSRSGTSRSGTSRSGTSRSGSSKPRARESAEVSRLERRYLRLFALLGVLLLLAGIASMLVRDRTLTVAVESIPNRTGDADYDGLSERLRGVLESSACPDSRIGLTRLPFLADTRVAGVAELDAKGIKLRAVVRSRGFEPEIVEVRGTAGIEPAALIEDLTRGVRERLDLALCERHAGCHCARLASQRLAQERLGEAHDFLRAALEDTVPGAELLDLAVDLSLERGEPRAAERYLALASEAVEIAEDEVWKHRLDRRRAQIAGDPASELQALKELRRLERDEPRWMLALGRHQLEHGRKCGESRSILENAQAFDGRGGLLALAEWALMCGELGEAERFLAILLERYPESAEILVRISRVARLAGRYPEAKSYLGRATRLVPDYPPALLEAAHLRLAQGYLTSAAEELAAYRRIAPWPSAVHDGALGEARAHLLAGDVSRALELAEAAEQALGTSPQILWIRGWAAVLDGRMEEAADLASAIRSLATKRDSRLGLELHHHLEGLIAFADEDWNASTDAFYDGLSLHPSEEAPFRLALARAFLQAGWLERAEEELDLLLLRNPNHGPALCVFGGIWQIRGKPQSAREHYRRAFSSWNEHPEDAPMQECRSRQRDLDTATAPR